MHIRSLIVCTLSVAVVLAVPACGSETDTGGNRGSSRAENDDHKPSRTPSPTTLSPSPEPDKNGDGDNGKPSESPAPDPSGPADLIAIDWVEPSSDKLQVHYNLPTPCSPGLQRASVKETSSAVKISLHREPESKKDGSMECAEVIVEESTTISLDRPLGDRNVIDADSGESVRIGD